MQRYPLASEASREVANLTRRKNLHAPVYGVKEFVCLSVCLFIYRKICFLIKKKNRLLANIQPSLHFYGMIILVKKGLCRGMAWLPFQKEEKTLSHSSPLLIQRREKTEMKM